MSFYRKIKAGLVHGDITQFVGEIGNIFFNVDTGELRLSDGVTPGGLPIMGGGGGGSAGGLGVRRPVGPAAAGGPTGTTAVSTTRARSRR